ncbi:MAG: class I SAM-dependent methyltransferase [Candidatus Eisenbacteria bacterium]
MVNLADTLCAFQRPDLHLAVSRIIQRYSTNPLDVRDFALQGFDPSTARDVLDLGCGFGFLTETLAPRLPADARVLGVDACDANREPFLGRLAAAGRTGEFLTLHIAQRLPWPAGSFDLIVCSYSLYFFPQILRELPRLLRPAGTLLVLTHWADSLHSLFEITGIAERDALLADLVGRFAAEQGAAVLQDHFATVTRRDYRNALRFPRAQEDDLLLYIQFKLPLLIRGASPSHDVPDVVRDAVRRFLDRHGEAILEKDDACFYCRSPRWP